MSEGVEPTIAELAGGSPEPAGASPAPSRSPRPFDWRRLVTAPTGPGDLSAYADHPLNPDPGSREGARIARGLEGMTGGARWAIVDILLGALGLMRRAAGRIGARSGA